jgi:hypothetical protein
MGMKYQLELSKTNDGFYMQVYAKIEGASLLELASKVPELVAKLLKEEHEHELRKLTDPDYIPF